MWKPGEGKPRVFNTTTSSASTNVLVTPKDRPLPPHDNGSQAISGPMAPPKRLSGLTMNMRFMKRKMEARSSASTGQRNSSGPPERTNGITTVAGHGTGPPPNAPGGDYPRGQQQLRDDVHMEVEGSNDRDGKDDQYESKHYYAQATSIDMYGMEASIIGRRSFGGFNAAMERAWKDSKAASENGYYDGSNHHGGSRQRISDEELIRRYQPNSQPEPRGVGNLDAKGKGGKRKKLRLR
jgi:M-phase phosphoprotein 6